MSEISGLYKLKSLCNMYGTLELSPARVARKPTAVTTVTNQKVHSQELKQAFQKIFFLCSRSTRGVMSPNLKDMEFVSNNQNCFMGT